MRKLAALVFAVLMVTGCADLFNPIVTGPFPPNTVSYVALDSYPTWWAELEKCADITGDLNTVHFWEVEGALNFRMPTDPSLVVYGYFTVPMNVVLAEQSMQFKPEVQHEMLHALLYMKFGRSYYASKDAHPDEYFKKRCPFVMQ